MQTMSTQLGIDESDEGVAATSADHIFETLSNPRRRQALRYLLAHKSDGTVLVRTLAEEVAAWENGVATTDVTYKQRKRVYTSLYQSHLPKLHRYGFIEYDADRGTVEVAPAARHLDVYLEVVPDGDLPWSEVYLATSATAFALVVALGIGAIPFLTVWQALVVCVTAFAFLSVAHTIRTRQSRV